MNERVRYKLLSAYRPKEPKEPILAHNTRTDSLTDSTIEFSTRSTPLLITVITSRRMPANPNPTSKPEAPTICDSYDSDDADVELISSDNVSFKVHSYRLQSASYAFSFTSLSRLRNQS